MRIIEKGGLVIIPRVTNMRNGMFRPEVAWSKGRGSDIIYGDAFENQLRAECMADLTAGAALLDEIGMDKFWEDMSRAVHGTRRLIDGLINQIA